MLRVEVAERAGRYRVERIVDETTGEVIKSGAAVDITWHQRSNLNPSLTVRVDGQMMRMARDMTIIIRHGGDGEQEVE